MGFWRYIASVACIGVALTLAPACQERVSRARVASPVRASVPSFADATYYEAGRGPRSVAIGDLNGDRTPDLAIANYPANTVSVLANWGDGRFPSKRNYRTGPHPSSVAIGDLNGDGKLDLVTANEGASVSVLLNRGDGGFRARQDYASPAANSVAIGDLNGDGKPDLATDHVAVLLNRGDGSFGTGHDYAIPANQSVALGDLNGDGRLDLVTAGTPDSEGAVSVFFNRGDGSLESRRIYGFPPGSSSDSVAIGDLNSDGASEVAIADADYGAVWVLVNRGDGNFGPHDYRNLHDYRTLGPGSRFPAPASIAIGDVNGDRKVDLAAVSYELEKVSVLLNLGVSRERKN